MERIPEELLLKIMEMACDEVDANEVFSQAMGHQNSFTQGNDWCWSLEKILNAASSEGSTGSTSVVARVLDMPEIHRRRLLLSMATKASLILVSKRWSRLSSKLLYRRILVKNRMHAEKLLEVFGNGKGEYTMELCVLGSPDGTLGIRMFPNLLASLLQLLPNLHILMIGTYFERGLPFTGENPPLWEAISNLRALKHVSLHYGIKSDDDVSYLFSRLPGLTSFASLSTRLLGAPRVTGYDVGHPSLDTLRVWSAGHEFIDYLRDCSLPNLKRLSVQFLPSDEPRISIHSFTMASVRTLDLSRWSTNSGSTLHMPEILAIFPNLIELAFTIDWKVLGTLAHKTVSRIGIYAGGTLFNFRSGRDPRWLQLKRVEPFYATAANDKLKALNKSNFPRLSTVQLLSPEDFHFFLSLGGTEALDESASSIWLEWRRTAKENNVRVLDCTGEEFGVMPDFGFPSGDVSIIY